MVAQLVKNGNKSNGSSLSSLVADYDTWDYDYGSHPRHLDDEEMIERYQSEQQRNPGALISVDGEDCGHWTIHVYSTELEKKLFYTKRLTELLSNALKLLTR